MHTTGTGWRRPEVLLILLSVAMPISFATWMALLNNFAIERAAFTGVEIGILQSLREIPGFLAFGVVFVLFLMREQTLGFVALLLLAIGTAITGVFATEIGLYVTTVIMSIGFHYFETIRQSLSLQWLPKDDAPVVMGKMIAAGSFASLGVYGMIWLLFTTLHVDMAWIYAAGGGISAVLVVFCWAAFPTFINPTEQHRTLFLRKRYWLYYALVFMGGARRQIFVVFAGFLMVEKFGYDVSAVTLLYIINHVASIWFAPWVGRAIRGWGERRVLTLEYIGLIGVFSAYAVTDTAWIAATLYVIDHLFFSMAIAQKTYLQKIADPADMAATAGVSFSINHIAAVVLPAALGLLWVMSPSYVFWAGAVMAAMSLALSQLVPRVPTPEMVSVLSRRPVLDAAE